MQNQEPLPQVTADIVTKPSCPETPDPVSSPKLLPHALPKVLGIFLGQDGRPYAAMQDAANPYALQVCSRQLNNVIRQLFHQEGTALRRNDLNEINEHLKAHAEMSGVRGSVWCRVAPVQGGIEIDVGDEKHTRIRVLPGNVQIIDHGSATLFYRSASALPMVMPADTGDINLLKKYLNMHPVSMALFIGWLSYTLAHPKQSSTKYVILLLQGNEGTGKTTLCTNIILGLVDPNTIGVRVLPTNPKDLAIASQNSHVLCYDNLRSFRESMADYLCVASTGGSIATRQLYTDDDQQVLKLHAALVLNGIHSFVDQPDLAQRCLPIHLIPMDEDRRKTDQEFNQSFQADLPIIMRGLLDLIANIMVELPRVEVTNPERMIDFVRWLAAMEKVQGVPVGVYQSAYSSDLRQGQLDSLQDSVLAAVLLEFAQSLGTKGWTGTPSDLLVALNQRVKLGTQRSRDWPQNPIALSKRLIPLQAAFLSQGIGLEFSRGKQRTIAIMVKGGVEDDRY
jgi:hypothetical protein